jgi:hypothetical protein
MPKTTPSFNYFVTDVVEIIDALANFVVIETSIITPINDEA